VHPLVEYGGRFAMEENFWDDKSHGFQLERALVRDAAARARLGLVPAVPPLSRVAQGPQVVAPHNRRGVEPHGLRGPSDVRSGWQGGEAALTRGWAWLTALHLSGAPDPEPARACGSQSAHAPPVTVTVTYFSSPAEESFVSQPDSVVNYKRFAVAEGRNSYDFQQKPKGNLRRKRYYTLHRAGTVA
jgi:hypothetical protein